MIRVFTYRIFKDGRQSQPQERLATDIGFDGLYADTKSVEINISGQDNKGYKITMPTETYLAMVREIGLHN